MLNTKNSTKQQKSCRLVEFLVFNSIHLKISVPSDAENRVEHTYIFLVNLYEKTFMPMGQCFFFRVPYFVLPVKKNPQPVISLRFFFYYYILFSFLVFFLSLSSSYFVVPAVAGKKKTLYGTPFNFLPQ